MPIQDESNTLAEDLLLAKQQEKDGIIKGVDLERGPRERLVRLEWLKEIIRGWYVLHTPNSNLGDSTTWYISYWAFVRYYLTDLHKNDYCLSAESSLHLHSGSNIIPQQTIVILRSGGSRTIDLPHKTSLLLYLDKNAFPEEIEKVDGINTMSLPLALCKVARTYYEKNHWDAEIALRMAKDASSLSRILVKNRMGTAAGILAGAYKFLGDNENYQKIISNISLIDLKIDEINPFHSNHPILSSSRVLSPYVARIEAMWKEMREDVIKIFSEVHSKEIALDECIRRVKEVHTHDAYHSLSIEGYQVSHDLIKQIARGDWNPNENTADRAQTDAMAAKGYYEAFLRVIESVRKMLSGTSPGEAIKSDFSTWYQELFLPSVSAGLLKSEDLVGYRNQKVYIKGAMHVPPPEYAVTDLMEKFLQLLSGENQAVVRAVLGHFIFVYIHPYMDGNGRIGRFLMNTMFVSGGYDWAVVRSTERVAYMAALEKASVEKDIRPLSKFLLQELEHSKEYVTKD